MFPVIVCIAKKESDYIEEFVKYHLALGFKYIYIYDNEDIPTYEKLLQNYKDNIKVMHLPIKGAQFQALNDFVRKYLYASKITHVVHIDIDEFIVLKKHKNIADFINEYIVGDCKGIAINYRTFGSSNLVEKTNIPVTMRFTMCEKEGNHHIKTLFKKDNFLKYHTFQHVIVKEGFIKSTNGEVILGPSNNIDCSVIQLNHYKCKTLPEFTDISTRGKVDRVDCSPENINDIFNKYNINDVEDLTASNFYNDNC